MKPVQVNDVCLAIREMVGPHNLVAIGSVGKAKGWAPDQLLPCIELLRRQWLVSCSVSDRERYSSEYETADGCNLVSVRAGCEDCVVSEVI